MKGRAWLGKGWANRTIAKCHLIRNHWWMAASGVVLSSRRVSSLARPTSREVGILILMMETWKYSHVLIDWFLIGWHRKCQDDAVFYCDSCARVVSGALWCDKIPTPHVIQICAKQFRFTYFCEAQVSVLLDWVGVYVPAPPLRSSGFEVLFPLRFLLVPSLWVISIGLWIL